MKSRMPVKQRETCRHGIVSLWRHSACRTRCAIRPGAFMSEKQFAALQCSEIVIDGGESGADSWEIAAQIRKTFGI